MRVLERFLSLLLALALVAGSVVLVLEVVWALSGRAPLLVPWGDAYDTGTRTAWESPDARLLSSALLAVGVVLLAVALKPRRVPRLAMQAATPAVDAGITRRSLRTHLLHAATRVDGISGATAKVGRRKVSVRATSRLGSAQTAQALTSDLETALRRRLDELQLARTPTLRARVAPRTSRRS